MGCCLSKPEILLETIPKSDLGHYVDIFETNINYSNPIHYNRPLSDNVVI